MAVETLERAVAHARQALDLLQERAVVTTRAMRVIQPFGRVNAGIWMVLCLAN